MNNYFLSKGAIKIPVGTKPPVYSGAQNGYVTDVGIFSTMNPEEYLITVTNEVTVTTNSNSIALTNATKNALPIPAVVTAAAFPTLWTTAETAQFAQARTTDSRVDAFFAAIEGSSNDIDFTVQANAIAVLLTVSAMPANVVAANQRSIRYGQIITGTPV